MKVTCLGHSGFAIETGEVTLIFDFYIDPSHVLDNILERAQKLYVFVSHSHRDHLCHDIFSWQQRGSVARYIIANECRRKLKRGMDLATYPITFLHHDEHWSDGMISVYAFASTDVGVSFVASIDKWLVYHAGDYTCWHFSEDNDNASIRKAQGDFHAILNKIKAQYPHLHLAMMPVVPNIGGDWAYGAREFLRAIDVDTFIPMHTWGRDREATQWHLYQNPNYGKCCYLPPGQSLSL